MKCGRKDEKQVVMATNRCMNSGCMAAAPAGEWRKGWALRAGGFAILCDKCGYGLLCVHFFFFFFLFLFYFGIKF